MNFLDRSPTPWHTVANISEYLEHSGFIRLDERMAWCLEAGASYFAVRSGGALVPGIPVGELACELDCLFSACEPGSWE